MTSEIYGMPIHTYICPKCGGQIMKVFPSSANPLMKNFRWTCIKCNRDYCWNTPEPCISKPEA